jgi:hypothetical protein
MHFSKSELKNSIALLLLFLITIALPAQQIRINEFMASNSTTIHDEDWDYEDWIEILNYGDESLNLLGYGLSDNNNNPYKWIFPDVTLQPGQLILIWSSGKDRANPDMPLHTNFSIKADGEELFLTDTKGTRIDETSPVALPNDISFGRLPDNPESWCFFYEPTPCGQNYTTCYESTTQSPVFSHPGGLYTEPFELTLTSSPGALILYSTNGKAPSLNTGTIYAGPFIISQTTIIRAVSYTEAVSLSEPKTMIYSFIGEDIREFKSKLPVVILHQFDTLITPGDRTSAAAVFVEPNQGDNTCLPGEIALQSRIVANVRGFTSQSYPKKMFGFHLRNELDSNRDESLFGMPAEHNWILYAPYSDKTLMRNVIAYNTAQGLGKYAPRLRLVELFLHNGNGPVTMEHYHGVYAVVERIKWGENRVNIQKISKADNAEPEISGGYIIKSDRLDAGQVGFFTEKGTNLAFVRPTETNMTSAQKDWIRNYINDFETTLFADNFNDPENGYHRFIDTESFIDHFLITELFREIDGYRLSTFMYKDRHGKLIMGPVWDFNLSLGNANFYQGWNTYGWHYPLVDQLQCTHWFTRLMDDSAYRNQLVYRWWELRQDLFSKEKLSALIYNTRDQLSDAQERNFNRWPVIGDYIWPNWYIGNSFIDEIDWMHNWLMDRIDWIDTQMGEPKSSPDQKLLLSWFINTDFPNNQPLQSVEPNYSIQQNSVLTYHSSLSGYPFTEGHALWRKASLERRNSPTSINYRPKGNNWIPYEYSEMRGLQVKQPFAASGGENTLIFQLSTTGYKEIVFSFAAKDEGAADQLVIDYSVNKGATFWISDGLDNPNPMIGEEFQHFFFDFGEIEEVNNNGNFKIRIRFAGEDMAADDGGRVCFNNFTIDGKALKMHSIYTANGVNGMISPSGCVPVCEMQRKDFLIQPEKNHYISTLLVDGNNLMDSLKMIEENAALLSFENVTKSHTIEVAFSLFSEIAERHENGVIIYPNPAKERVNVFSLMEIKRVGIFNLQGQMFSSYESVFSNDFVFSIEYLINGLYLVRVETTSGVVFKKMTVTR